MKNRKGAVLIIVIVFILVAVIMSAALYNSAYFVGKMQGLDEVRRIRGYYAAAAGLSYASVILIGTYSSPVSLKSYNLTLWNDLGLKNSEDVIITITDIGSGQYDVTSAFTF